jgi:hypothetical protein
LVSVLAIEANFRGLKSSRGRDLAIRAIKFRRTTSFGVEIKTPVPCHKILHVKKTEKCEKRYFVTRFMTISRKVSPVLLLGVFAG